MRVHVNSEILKKAVGSVSRFLATKTPLPAYECINLEVDAAKKTLTLKTMNAQYSVGTAEITCEPIGLEESVSVWVTGDVFSDAVRCSEGDVSMEISDKRVALKYPSGSASIPTIHQEIVPETPDFNGDNIFEGDSSFLRESILTAASAALDCGIIPDASTGQMLMYGCRGGSWAALHPLGAKASPGDLPPVTFNSQTASALASGCLGVSSLLQASHNRIRILSKEEGLAVTTEVSQDICKPFTVAPLRKLTFSEPVLVATVGELATSLRRVATVKQAESMCCDINSGSGKLSFSLMTDAGEATSECAATCQDEAWSSGDGGWIVSINAERTSSLLRCMQQKESVSVELAKRGENAVALRFIQGDIELMVALTMKED